MGLIYRRLSASLRPNETLWHEGGRDVKRAIEFYNLDAIISVGYRVNSAKATLSPVESAYRESVKALEKEVKEKIRKDIETK